MKAETDQAGPLSIPMGQINGRQTHRSRVATDRLLENFERLLAKQSDPQDMGLELKDETAPEVPILAQPPIISDAALIAVAKLDQLAAGLAQGEPQATTKIAADDEPEKPALKETASDDVELEDQSDQPTDIRPALIPTAHVSVAHYEKTESRKPETTDKPQALPVTAVAQKEPVRSPAVPTTDSPPVIAEDQSQPSKETKPAVLVNVTATQETHFAPAAPIVFDNPAPPLATVDGTPAPRETAPPPPLIQAPSLPAVGPLKMLKLQLDTSELGPVNAIMALKDDGLDLRIAAVKEEAVMALRENAGKLSDALQSLGYSIDTVTVQKLSLPDAVQASASSQPMQQGSAGQGGSNQAQWDLNGAQAGAGGSSRQSKQTPQNGGQFAEHEGNGESQGAGGVRAGGDVFV